MYSQLSVLLSVGFCVSVAQAAVLSFWPEKSNGSEWESGKAVLSKDVRYDKWLNPTRILYRFDDNSYSINEKALIMTAMSQIAADMDKCISFQEYNADTDAGSDNIYISKTLNDGSIPATCFTFYGRLLRAAGQGQKMAIHDGPNGCMDSQREIMKILVNVLGLRNEYNRPDRDDFIKVFPANLQQELRFSNLLSEYNQTQVDMMQKSFDYHSITIPKANKYAIENETIFAFPAHQEIPNLNHLSKDDCLGLSWMYGCSAAKCADPYEVAALAFNEQKILIDAHHEDESTTAAIAVASAEAAKGVVTEASTVAATEFATSAAAVIESTQATTEALTAELKLAATEAAVLESSTAAAAAPMPQALPANLTEAVSTTWAPVLNVTLSDVIFPRKAVSDIAVDVAVASTEGPMVVLSESSSASTLTAVMEHHEDASTLAAMVESTTTVAPQMKLIVILASQNASAVESSTEAAISAIASTEAAPAAATSAAAAVESSSASSEAPASSSEAWSSTSAAWSSSSEASSSSLAPVSTAAAVVKELIPAVVVADRSNDTSIVMVIALDNVTSTTLAASSTVEMTTAAAASSAAEKDLSTVQSVEAAASRNSTEMLAQ